MSGTNTTTVYERVRDHYPTVHEFFHDIVNGNTTVDHGYWYRRYDLYRGWYDSRPAEAVSARTDGDRREDRDGDGDDAVDGHVLYGLTEAEAEA